ncbi:MAG: hypothetical protein AB8G26_03005 [Ilumatobacter sp.]
MTVSEPSGGLVTTTSGAHYRIDGLERMEPFLTTVVSDSDLWMFVSSTGALTAGRRNADHSIFPYQTDDRLHRAAGRVGPVTVIARGDGSARELWRPFGPDLHLSGPRSIAKHVSGNRLVFEEFHPTWRLRWRATWAPSDAFGWVRTSEIVNESVEQVEIEVLDGVVDVMPDGVDAFFEQIRSNLVDAYKRSETGPWGSLAIFNLETLITDQAEPMEALSATTIWSSGFDNAQIDLDERAVLDMLAGRATRAQRLIRGRTGAYLRRGTLEVSPGSTERFTLACDTGVGHAAVERLVAEVRSGVAASQVRDDIARGAAGLDALLDAAEGRQSSGDPVADAHHRSNVLFNSMRGGALVDGPNVPLGDLVEFVRSRNPSVDLGPIADVGTRHVGDLLDDVRAAGDPDLTRLVLEYLPLTFSRRHGDPSRPWNRFDIDIRTDDGEQRLTYEGNWRDIFQNWEALFFTTPSFLPSVVAKFVNATSAEGYNAYRLTRSGIEWEVPDPADPWAHIGYWGDHQLVYLLRLVELWGHIAPGEIGTWLDQRVFSFVDIPYRLAEHADMIADSNDTIVYDEAHAAVIAEREADHGADGRLLVDHAGRQVRVGLAEKLLVPALAKLACFVPGAGVWLNTQRPEWNDANNALAGSGASIVTLFHLRRYLDRLADILLQGARSTIEMSGPVAEWVRATSTIVHDAPVDPSDVGRSREFIDAVGTLAARHRAAVRAGADFTVEPVEREVVVAMCRRAVEHIDATLDRSRRADGLFHSYNLVSFPSAGVVEVGHLGPMLEGQVAALSSGRLSSDAAADLITTALESDLHRADLDTLLLYPATEIPSFLERNLVTNEQHDLLRGAAIGTDTDTDTDTDTGTDMVSAAMAPDVTGRPRFRPGISNRGDLVDALERSRLTADQIAAVLSVYEGVFDHRSFTGRSGRMYGYEGLGSVYWHMVAKLLLAVQEEVWSALDRDEPTSVIVRLTESYRRLRDGFGFRMSPALFGAFPTDCYSHSPAHSGAQQPGMTGQVKEEILTRFGELGLRVHAGRIRLTPTLLPIDEVLGSGVASFTFCGVTMSIERAATDRAVVITGDGEYVVESLELPAETSAEVFSRRGTVTAVRWHLGGDTLERWRSATGPKTTA